LRIGTGSVIAVGAIANKEITPISLAAGIV